MRDVRGTSAAVGRLHARTREHIQSHQGPAPRTNEERVAGRVVKLVCDVAKARHGEALRRDERARVRPAQPARLRAARARAWGGGQDGGSVNVAPRATARGTGSHRSNASATCTRVHESPPRPLPFPPHTCACTCACAGMRVVVVSVPAPPAAAAVWWWMTAGRSEPSPPPSSWPGWAGRQAVQTGVRECPSAGGRGVGQVPQYYTRRRGLPSNAPRQQLTKHPTHLRSRPPPCCPPCPWAALQRAPAPRLTPPAPDRVEGTRQGTTPQHHLKHDTPRRDNTR
jgi:hypothetical protein